jgi:hypothetical protein
MDTLSEHGSIAGDDSSYRTVEDSFRQLRNPMTESLHAFTNNPSIIANPDGPYHFHDRSQNKKYFFKETSMLVKFMDILNNCWKENIRYCINEIQRVEEPYSGIEIDLDIKYRTFTVKTFMDANVVRYIIAIISKTIRDFVDMPDLLTKLDRYYIGVLRKPTLVNAIDKLGVEFVKDGLHFRIPELGMAPLAKKLLMIDLRDKIGNYLKSLQNAPFLDGVHPGSFVDQGVARAPIHILGASSKRDAKTNALSVPYELDSVYKIELNEFGMDMPIAEHVPELRARHNMVLEMSLNIENPNPVTRLCKKIVVKCIPAIEDRILTVFRNGTMHDNDEERLTAEMNNLHMQKPASTYIKALIDCLNPKRAENHSNMEYPSRWYVIQALANLGAEYKPLAELFARTAPHKFDLAKFNHRWQEACTKRDAYKYLGETSLRNLARLDNPQKFKMIRENRVQDLVRKMIYNPTTKGLLKEDQIAEILAEIHKDRYVTDVVKEGGRTFTWFEFEMDPETAQPGHLYKWTPYREKSPPSLHSYIVDNLYQLFSTIHGQMSNRISAAPGHKPLAASANNVLSNMDPTKNDGQLIALKQITDNFGKTCSNLKTCALVNNTIAMFANRVARPGFARDMDKDKNVVAVYDGILVFDPSTIKVTYINGLHSYKVSNGINVDYTKYMPFNAKCPDTIWFLSTFRNMFMDEESDVVMKIMCMFGSCLTACSITSLYNFHGRGANGKSRFVMAVLNALGKYADSRDVSLITSAKRNSESATPELMSIEKLNLVVMDEVNHAIRIDLGRFKALTAGGGKVSGRNLNQETRSFEPKSQLVMLTNSEIIIPEIDDAFWRRYYHITMRYQFLDSHNPAWSADNPFIRDPDSNWNDAYLKSDKMRSIILSILILYWQILHIRFNAKLDSIPCPHILLNNEEMKETMDTFNTYINRFMVRTAPETKTRTEDIIKGYQTWYLSTYGRPIDTRMVETQLKQSKIFYMIKNERTGKFIVGYRFLVYNETPKEEEVFFFKMPPPTVIHDGQAIPPPVPTSDDKSETHITRECKKVPVMNARAYIAWLEKENDEITEIVKQKTETSSTRKLDLNDLKELADDFQYMSVAIPKPFIEPKLYESGPTIQDYKAAVHQNIMQAEVYNVEDQIAIDFRKHEEVFG